MFSGIIEERATVAALRRQNGTAALSVESGLDHAATKLGDSIAIDGVCLTVVEKRGGRLSFDVSQETLRRSTIGRLGAGDRVNLERSLSLGQRIHGHLVYGHVDGTAALHGRRSEGDGLRLEWKYPAALRRFIVEKGSIAVAGVSLTVGEVSNESFVIYAIPHTLALTTLSVLEPGQQVNLEVDMLGRYVESMLKGRGEPGGVSMEFLRQHGYVADQE